MEKWDILDINRNVTGKTIVRGETLRPGEFHLVVLIFVVNSKKEILITKRSKKERWCTALGNQWRCGNCR